MSTFYEQGCAVGARLANLKTAGDVIDALRALKSPEDAQEFMAAYRLMNPTADQDVGYLTGYLDGETANRIMEWCGTPHPVFGAERQDGPRC